MKKKLNSAGEMLQDDNFVFLKEWQLQEANEDMLTSSAWYSLSSGPCPDFVKQVVGILIHIPLTAPSANSQVLHKSGWLVWESEECHFLLADAPVPDTSGMPRVIAHWSALVCVCVCVCARACVCVWICVFSSAESPAIAWEGNEPNRDTTAAVSSDGWFNYIRKAVMSIFWKVYE